MEYCRALNLAEPQRPGSSDEDMRRPPKKAQQLTVLAQADGARNGISNWQSRVVLWMPPVGYMFWREYCEAADMAQLDCEAADMAQLDGATTDTAGRLLSKNLAGWRRDNTLVLRQIAPKLGVSVSTLDAWERNTRFPTGEHLDKIAAYTGIPVCRLFCRRPEESCPLTAREKPIAASDRGQQTGRRDP